MGGLGGRQMGVCVRVCVGWGEVESVLGKAGEGLVVVGLSALCIY